LLISWKNLRKTSKRLNISNSAYYILEPEVLDRIPEGYCMMEKDIFPNLAREGKLFGYRFDGQWFDVGTFSAYEEAIKNWRESFRKI